MGNLKIVMIDDKYIRYISAADKKVQYSKGAKRPYVGVVLLVGQHKYFVPMESPKPNHTNMKKSSHLYFIDGGNLGLLGFNNMIPVPDNAIINFDIKSITDQKYKGLLLRQASAVNKAKAAIALSAADTYYKVVNNKNKFLVGISCDFQKLELLATKYNPNYKAKLKQQ